MENGNWRILVLWKTRIGELFFILFFIREFSFCGKRELENSRFVKNQNWRIFFFLIRAFSFCGNGEFSICGKRELEISRFVKNLNRRIFFLSENSRSCKTRIRESSFFEKTRIPVFFFFHPRILVLWKTGTGEFSFCGKPESENFFFIREFSFCGKRELENSRFVKNQNWRFFFLSENSRFVETENSRFVENGNWRFLVL